MIVTKKKNNTFQVDDDEKDAKVQIASLKGKEIDKLSASEAKTLTLIMAKMLGLVDSTGKIK